MEKYRPTSISDEGINQAQLNQFNYQVALLSKSKIKHAAVKAILNRWRLSPEGKPFGYVLTSYSVEGDSNQIEQPLQWEGGYSAARNRFMVVKERHPDILRQSDLIIIIENYMDLDGKDFACLILYDCHQKVEYQCDEFCAQAEDMELFQEVINNSTHKWGSTITYGQLLHQKDSNIPSNDWMSVVTGKNRQTALEEGLLNLSHLFLSDQEKIQEIEGKFKLYEDFPEKGVTFKDWSDIFLDWSSVDLMANLIARPFQTKSKNSLFDDQFQEIDYVIGLESRGIWLAVPIARILHCGMVPARKPNKIPNSFSVGYQKEYGKDTLEIRNDLPKGANVIICDDVLATGGSLMAGIELAEMAGLNVIGCVVVTDVPELRSTAAEKLKNYWVRVLVQEGLRGDLIKTIDRINHHKN